MKDEGGRRKAEFLRPRSSFSPQPSAFTLTELLVVITIIAILASLITGAAINALNRAKQAAVTLELKNIDGALQDVKNDYGAYPPNAMVQGTAPTNYLAQTDFVRMFKKAFPRSQESDALINALAGGPQTGVVTDSQLVDQGMNGAEAVYFWLGGFSEDPSYPISGPGGPSFDTSTTQGEVLEDRNQRYEFDLGRLIPRTSDGQFDDTPMVGRYIEYNDPKTGNTRRINFWRYTPKGSTVPIAYFDTSRHKPFEYDLDLSGGQGIYALKQRREGISDTATLTNADIIFVEQGKFQLLHSGLDDTWGDEFAQMHVVPGVATGTPNSPLLLAPEGPFLGDVADTLGNFMEGTLEDKSE